MGKGLKEFVVSRTRSLRVVVVGGGRDEDIVLYHMRSLRCSMFVSVVVVFVVGPMVMMSPRVRLAVRQLAAHRVECPRVMVMMILFGVHAATHLRLAPGRFDVRSRVSTTTTTTIVAFVQTVRWTWLLANKVAARRQRPMVCGTLCPARRHRRQSVFLFEVILSRHGTARGQPIAAVFVFLLQLLVQAVLVGEARSEVGVVVRWWRWWWWSQPARVLSLWVRTAIVIARALVMVVMVVVIVWCGHHPATVPSGHHLLLAFVVVVMSPRHVNGMNWLLVCKYCWHRWLVMRVSVVRMSIEMLVLIVAECAWLARLRVCLWW